MKFKKAEFCLCIRDREGIIAAKKVAGWAYGEIGLHQQTNRNWRATHIPTGYSLDVNGHETRAGALKAAQHNIAKNIDIFETKIKGIFASHNYKDFMRAIGELEATDVA